MFWALLWEQNLIPNKMVWFVRVVGVGGVSCRRLFFSSCPLFRFFVMFALLLHLDTAQCSFLLRLPAALMTRRKRTTFKITFSFL